MTVRIIVFKNPSDRRAWVYSHVTKAQKEKLFKLFGKHVRVTDHITGAFGDEFVVAGNRVWLTPRGRVMTEKDFG